MRIVPHRGFNTPAFAYWKVENEWMSKDDTVVIVDGRIIRGIPFGTLISEGTIQQSRVATNLCTLN